MSLKYNIRHLTEMLSRDDLSREDKSAIRFALWNMGAMAQPPTLPYWRYVQYTDDGSALYECLDCKARWDTRSAPGWFNEFEDVDGPGDGVMSYEQKGKTVYYRKRDEPLYVRSQTYCGYCGIEWKGPIRSNVDNEYMLGPRRKRIQDATRDNYKRFNTLTVGFPMTRTNYKRFKPEWWWVIQHRTYWFDRPTERQESWRDVNKMSPYKFNAVKAHERLVEERVRGHDDEPMFNTEEQYRIVRKTNKELEGVRGYCSVYELHNYA